MREHQLEASTVRLRESEALWRAIFDNAGIGIAVLNQHTGILQVNTTMQEMFGYTEAELLTMTMTALAHPTEALGDLEAFQRVCTGDLPRYQVEKRYYRKDGHLLWGRFTATAIQDVTAQQACVIGMLEDITERKRGEEELQRRAEALQRLNLELEHSNRELDAFAYIASHDLREPLRGIYNFSHFLLEDYADKLDTSGVEKLHTLMRLTRRMEALIESLLYYSQIGRVELAIEDIDMQEIVDETLELLASRLQEGHVQVRLPTRLPTVRADRVQMGEIFANLIANAIKYNDKAEKWVEIGCEVSPDVDETTRQVFYVRDNGIGIATQHYESIFRIFRRLHGREEYGGGTGVGLPIVRKIVERHSGHIWLVSQPDVGTTFYFTLGASIRGRGYT